MAASPFSNLFPSLCNLAADTDEVGIGGVHPGGRLGIMTVEALSHLGNYTLYRRFVLKVTCARHACIQRAADTETDRRTCYQGC
jgi:hypothetical protein